ncbi:type II secretion system F family protein [Arthrobacter sp. NPDC092385]|uniref:type II secretion system F family protein n=1 Tax=Arthrobacter sp. NPDC092385 TaxID=3363943 RepID=UPI00382F1136
MALLLATACAILTLPRPARAGAMSALEHPGSPGAAPAPAALGGPPRPGSTGFRQPGLARLSRRTRLGGRPRIDLHELPLFVHQMAGLLRAGRPPQTLWTDMELVYADGRGGFAAVVSPVIATARRAAELGLSVPDALLHPPGGHSGDRAEAPGSTHVERLWIDLAGCLMVAERSGAPLAEILEHYAAQLDAQLDGLSARETALAGPRATVVLLAWLPAVGLVLGFALGINPLEVLLGSPLGRAALGTGALLMTVARVWSRRLVRVAEGGEP